MQDRNIQAPKSGGKIRRSGAQPILPRFMYWFSLSGAEQKIIGGWSVPRLRPVAEPRGRSLESRIAEMFEKHDDLPGSPTVAETGASATAAGRLGMTRLAPHLNRSAGGSLDVKQKPT